VSSCLTIKSWMLKHRLIWEFNLYSHYLFIYLFIVMFNLWALELHCCSWGTCQWLLAMLINVHNFVTIELPIFLFCVYVILEFQLPRLHHNSQGFKVQAFFSYLHNKRQQLVRSKSIITLWTKWNQLFSI
jgi:hypothetical protein